MNWNNLNFFEIHIDSLKIPISNKTFADIFENGKEVPLRKFQWNFFRAISEDENRLIILKAPTGAGKTACVVIANCIFDNIACLYPTRELIYDQAASIFRIYKDLVGIIPKVLPEIGGLYKKLINTKKVEYNDLLKKVLSQIEDVFDLKTIKI